MSRDPSRYALQIELERAQATISDLREENRQLWDEVERLIDMLSEEGVEVIRTVWN